MTWNTKYIADHAGRCRKISELSKKQVGTEIANCYYKLRTLKVQLNHLHDRLWEVRKAEGSKEGRTDTNKKILENMGMKKVEVLEKNPDYGRQAKRIQRLETIIHLAIQNLEKDEDKEIVKLILQNYEVKEND